MTTRFVVVPLVSCLISLLGLRVDAQTVDATTLNNKVMCGYQGWFTCNGDFSTPPVGWMHWTHTNFTTQIKYDFDMWPDVSELGAGELFTAPGVTLLDSTPGKLYSATTTATVDRHFQWMQTYGIDGVFLQRFVSELSNSSLKSIRDQVLGNVRAGANAHGRVFAMEYDLSNDPTATMFSDVTNDWKYLVDTKGMLTDPRYLKHNGKPVVVIWGLGFVGRGITPALAQSIIDFFKSDPTYGGNIVIGGVPSNWRTLNGDSETDPAWLPVYHSFNIIHPWTVGRYSTPAQALTWKTSVVIPDIADCQANGCDYMPVAWPGYSFDNSQGHVKGTTLIPRRGGDFFWKQLSAFQNGGANKAFIAMFDEVNEGTAIYKVSSNYPNDAPSGTPPPPYQWVTTEGLGSDWYLKLTGSGTQMMRNQFAQTSTIPVAGWPTFGSTSLVISQIYGGGGINSQSTYRNDFVELYNPGLTTVNFATTNHSIQYTTATGTAWTKLNLTAGSVAPGKYFLIKLASGGANGVVLPTEDLDGSGAGIDLDNNAGKVALVQGTGTISGDTYPPTVPVGSSLVDYAGYGSGNATVPTGWEGFAGPVESPSTTRNDMSFSRTQDTDDNSNDFFYSYARARNSAYVPPINSGTAGGTVHINASGGADYTSLATAVADIDQAYGGINGNWNIIVDGDLTEAQNLGVACNVAAGKTITLKPNTATNPTITFSATGGAAGLNGHLFIGLNSTVLSSDVNMRDMHGFTIDGSNNGTSSRNLTLQNAAGSGVGFISAVIRIIGQSNGVTIKNCTIKNLSTNSTTQDQCCVKVDTRSSFVDLVPSNVRIDNCNLQALGSINGVGIRTDVQGTIAPGTGQSGMMFTRNTISAKARGLRLTQTASGLVTTNTIAMTQTGNVDSIAIDHSGSNSASGWTLTIADNTISTLQTATTVGTVGATGISLAGAGSGSSATYSCYNNVIGGFSFTGSPTSPLYRGIIVADANVTANIFYNSINMVSAGAGANANAAGISFSNAGYTGAATVRDNIIRLLQNGASTLSFANTSLTTVTSNNNDLFVAATAFTGKINATTYGTLSAWQGASGKDAASISSDPTIAHAPYTGTWTSSAAAPNDLHFTADPGTDFDAPLVSGINWDVDGQPRSGATRNKGADAPTAIPAGIGPSWTSYGADGP